MLNRTLAPDFKQVNSIDFIHPKQNTLNNGIPVYTVFSDKQDLVRIEFIFENVDWNAEKPLQAMVTNALINNGTKKYSAKEIAEQVDFYGAFVQTEYGQDQSTVTVYSLNKHLSDVLPIVKDILSNSQFSQPELDLYIQNQKQKLQVNLEKNDFLARKAFANALFGDTSYGLYINESHYDAVKREDLIDFYKKAYNPENCTIIIAGKFMDGELVLLNNIFGQDWTSEPRKISDLNFDKTAKKIIYTERKDAIQSAIRLGRVSINRKHEDFAGLQVLNTVLGGYFGSRLMANIREDKGYTYGIGSGIASLKHGGYFFVSTEIGTEVCAPALSEIYKEIQILQDDEIQSEELDLVRNYMLGSMLGSLENVFSHADKFKNIHFSGMGYEYYDKYIKTVKNIQPDELNALAKEYLNTDDFVEVVVGKK